MPEHPDWRLERYSDEADLFALPQFYVMHGNVMIAQCEIEAHAVRIVEEHERLGHYEQVLKHISSMTAASHDLEAAIAAALGALDRRD